MTNSTFKKCLIFIFLYKVRDNEIASGLVQNYNPGLLKIKILRASRALSSSFLTSMFDSSFLVVGSLSCLLTCYIFMSQGQIEENISIYVLPICTAKFQSQTTCYNPFREKGNKEFCNCKYFCRKIFPNLCNVIRWVKTIHLKILCWFESQND